MTTLPIIYCVVLVGLAMASSAVQAGGDLSRLADSIASPLFESFEDARGGYVDSRVMFRNEVALQVVAAHGSADAALERVRQVLLSSLQTCNASLARIRKLDASTPDFEALAKRSLKALPALDDKRRDAAGNLRPDDRARVEELAVEGFVQFGGWLWDQYQASEERGRYQKCNRMARRAGLALSEVAQLQNAAPKPIVFGIGVRLDDRADGLRIEGVTEASPASTAGLAAGDRIVAVADMPVTSANARDMVRSITGSQGTTVRLAVDRGGEIRPVSVRRTVPIQEVPLLEVSIVDSLDGFYASDYVYYRNVSGRDLSDVVLNVDLKGRHGRQGRAEGDRHLHYVGRWPAGELKVARYMSSSASGIAQDESVDHIETLRYDLYSAEFAQSRAIQYAGEQYDATLKELCDHLQLLGSWRSFPPDHWAYKSGFLLQNGEQGRALRATRVTVRARWGDDVVGYRWTMKDNVLPSGTSDALPLAAGRYFSDAAFNRGKPDSVEVAIEFPYSESVCTKAWALAR